jgi:hypothetical protein
MAAYSGIRTFFVLCTVTCSVSQVGQQAPKDTGPTTLARVALHEASRVKVPSLPAESVVAPLRCDAGGRIFFRLAMPDTGVEDPLSVSSNGESVVRFASEKVTDISRPHLLSVFPSGSDVYILTSGSIALGYNVKLQKPNGETLAQQAVKSTKFVARFQRDGTYRDAIPLDVPFQPLQLGVFENGDFLVAGVDPATVTPRVAIVGSNGQFRRFVELEGDVHPEDTSRNSANGGDSTALPNTTPPEDFDRSFMGVVYTSAIVQDGPHLLLFRPANGPVFSVSPSGETTARQLKIKGDYRLYAIKSTRSSWIVEFIHDVPNSKLKEFSTFAFHPESGEPLREYFFPADLGWGLACTDGDEFTFVMADNETNTLNLIKLTDH